MQITPLREGFSHSANLEPDMRINPVEYEKMMVEAAGGLPSAKPMLIGVDMGAGDDRSVETVIVQNDMSFRESFMERLFLRGAVVRIVGE